MSNDKEETRWREFDLEVYNSCDSSRDRSVTIKAILDRHEEHTYFVDLLEGLENTEGELAAIVPVDGLWREQYAIIFYNDFGHPREGQEETMRKIGLSPEDLQLMMPMAKRTGYVIINNYAEEIADTEIYYKRETAEKELEKMRGDNPDRSFDIVQIEYWR